MDKKYLDIRSILIGLFFCTLILSSSACSQNRDEVTFDIVSGSVTLTPSGFGGSIVSTQATLSGSFVGFLPGGGRQLFFSSSSIVSSPDIHFQLPEDPNLDSGGTTREASFTYDENSLSVKGKIDSRAFDGPLIEYTFQAKTASEKFSAYGLFSVRPDLRRCVAPLCSGYFVKRVNNAKTLCVDGTKQAECYVASLGFNGAAFSGVIGDNFAHTSSYLVRGKILPEDYANFGNLGTLKVSEIYKSVVAPKNGGRFYGIKDNGIRCITAPCPSTSAHLLNRKKTYEVSAYELEKTGASEQDIRRARKVFENGGVLFVSGKIYSDLEQHLNNLIVEQIFLPTEF